MKYYIAYAIHRGEQACGCSRTTYSHVYDSTGNKYKRFTSRKKAEEAAIAKMEETNADACKVI